MAGPLVFVPLTSIIGRSSLVFWSLIPFVISRLMAGLFGSLPAVLTSGYIVGV